MELHDKVITSKMIYEGKIFKVKVDTVELPNGRTSTREIVVHPGAVAVVPLTEDKKVVMVKQYRHSTGEVTLEIPAGKIDAGETPEECGKRELKEETGYSSSNIIPMFTYTSSPGFTDEKIYIYLATGLKAGDPGGDDDEFIQLDEIPLESLVQQIFEGKIKDGKTISGILGAYYLINNKETGKET